LVGDNSEDNDDHDGAYTSFYHHLGCYISVLLVVFIYVVFKFVKTAKFDRIPSSMSKFTSFLIKFELYWGCGWKTWPKNPRIPQYDRQISFVTRHMRWPSADALTNTVRGREMAISLIGERIGSPTVKYFNKP
jgi:hypothetical protein